MSIYVGYVGWILFVVLAFFTGWMLDRAEKRRISDVQAAMKDMFVIQNGLVDDLRDLNLKIATATTLKEVRDHIELRFRQHMQEHGIAPSPVLVRVPKEKSDAHQS